MAHPMLAPVIAFLSKLRYPQLFKLTVLLFALDLMIPDMIPFADELLLAMGTLVLGNWKKRREGTTIDAQS